MDNRRGAILVGKLLHNILLTLTTRRELGKGLGGVILFSSVYCPLYSKGTTLTRDMLGSKCDNLVENSHNIHILMYRDWVIMILNLLTTLSYAWEGDTCAFIHSVINANVGLHYKLFNFMIMLTKPEGSS